MSMTRCPYHGEYDGGYMGFGQCPTCAQLKLLEETRDIAERQLELTRKFANSSVEARHHGQDNFTPVGVSSGIVFLLSLLYFASGHGIFTTIAWFFIFPWLVILIVQGIIILVKVCNKGEEK